SRRRAAWAVLSLLTLNACFSYVPVGGDLPGPGARVSVQLHAPQQLRAQDFTADDVVEVRGNLVGADTAQVLLVAVALTSSSGHQRLGVRPTMQVPRLNIAHVRENRISPLRTAALAGVAVAGTVIFARLKIVRPGPLGPEVPQPRQ
ncbi:MAG: hypothetical protein KY464_18520, partial [Gemmatimonadetes bacterium]|nr:hypothetical protein [Gemmatimonadota bacterium]